jgi:hypothetical protein
MIITILPNSSNFHAVAYNEKKVSQGLAELIEVRNFSYFTSPKDYTAENFTDYLETYSHRNTRIQSAQFHVAISPVRERSIVTSSCLTLPIVILKRWAMPRKASLCLVYAHHDTDKSSHPHHHESCCIRMVT